MMEVEVKQNITKLFEDLRLVVKSGKEIEDIIHVLDSIINVTKIPTNETIDFITDDMFLILLHHESMEIVANTAKAIAEIAKNEKGREKCTRIDLVTALIDLFKEESIDVLIQTSRALGNICYENEDGKKLIESKNGLAVILSVLKKSTTLNIKGSPFFRTVAAGLLLNFLTDRSSLYKEAIQCDIINIICNVLEIDGTTGGDAAMHALLIAGIFNDDEIIFLNERFIKILMNILDNDELSELSEMSLKLLHNQAEDENVKVLLAEAGVCELLLKLMHKYNSCKEDEEAKPEFKMACSLIVLILAGDESMEKLYNNNNGAVYKTLVEWLEHENKDLQITAALAMGNFARTDTHCKHMVTQGVHRSLLKLLQNINTDMADIRFQYALLGVLKNLVIPTYNKPIMLEDGLIDILYSMLNTSSYPVIFKLLGTLRIVIEGQSNAAIQLGKRNGFITKIIEWCDINDHMGVQGEANRLVAWLINNSRNKEIALLVINHGAVNFLAKMLITQHILMQNEALISLIILTTTCLLECERPLLEADIGGKLCRFLDNVNNLELPILHNAFSLLDNITNSDILRKHLGQYDFITLCQKLTNTKEDLLFQDQLNNICDKLNNIMESE